jgi:tetratricopeptide (TPR) repeat protein
VCFHFGFTGFFVYTRAIESSYDPSPESKDLVKKVEDAKDLLRSGVNTWDETKMLNAREIFLDLLLKGKNQSAHLNYYVAFCDYRLASFYISKRAMDKVAYHAKEGQKYLDKAKEIKPDWGEPFALCASLIGFDMATNPQESMSLVFQLNDNLEKAVANDPENPRVNLIKGISVMYTPAQFGGGADVAIPTLTKSVSFFEKEKVDNPMVPSWGIEEAYTFLAMAYQQKGDKDKAVENFTKALEINPDFTLARDELKKLEEE